jgi:glyoxylase-like metal-dependent hydrolase (beta-lactamase superfamily II)
MAGDIPVREPNLVELGQGVYALVDPVRGFGHTNVGLVIEPDGLTIIDTAATPAQAARTATRIGELTAELALPLKRVVMTSSRVVFSGGSGQFWSAAFYGSDVTSDHLDRPPNPEAFRRLLPELAAAYPDDFQTRPITHTVSEAAWISGATYGVPLPGESAMNLAVVVPSANVVFAGALACFGVTPLGYDAYPEPWLDSLSRLTALASTIVPGHGMPGGRADIDDLAGYLRATAQAHGEPSRLGPGPWDSWSDRRFDGVNVERAATLARGVDEIPQAMFELLGL